MKDWFHEILGHLYHTYPLDHSFHNINDFLQEKFEIDNVNGNDLHRLSGVISILRTNGYIDGLPQVKNKSELNRTQVIGVYPKGFSTRNSLLTHNVEVRLTIKGHAYYEDKIIKGLTSKNLEQSILWTKDWWITIAINAAIAVGISIVVHLSTQESKQTPTTQSSKQLPLSDSSRTNKPDSHLVSLKIHDTISTYKKIDSVKK